MRSFTTCSGCPPSTDKNMSGYVRKTMENQYTSTAAKSPKYSFTRSKSFFIMGSDSRRCTKRAASSALMRPSGENDIFASATLFSSR